jgi:hypothetical protein
MLLRIQALKTAAISGILNSTEIRCAEARSVACDDAGNPVDQDGYMTSLVTVSPLTIDTGLPED